MPQLNLLRSAQPIGIMVSLFLREDGRWEVGATCVDHTGKETVHVVQTARRGSLLEYAEIVCSALIQHWVSADEEGLGQVLNEELRTVHRMSVHDV